MTQTARITPLEVPDETFRRKLNQLIDDWNTRQVTINTEAKIGATAGWTLGRS